MCLCYLFSAKRQLVNRKADFFYKTNRFESIRITNRIYSNRELECSTLCDPPQPRLTSFHYVTCMSCRRWTRATTMSAEIDQLFRNSFSAVKPTAASLPALGTWAPAAERGLSLDSIYWVYLSVDLCKGNKRSLKNISPQPVEGPSKRKKSGGPGHVPSVPIG